jgi:RNA polymerase sigma-70 factor (ECF subfamily)
MSVKQTMQANPATRALADSELAVCIADGDKRAFEEVMRRHNRVLFRTARAILRDDAEAEDALQDAYIQAFRSMDSFRGASKLSTWLVRIVVNQALMRRRKRARTAQVIAIREDDGRSLEHVEEDQMSEREGPERTAGRAELRRLLEARIDSLPDAFRAVFVLRAVEELSVEETAAALGIPEATVRTRFFRARSLLREAFSQEIDLALGDAFAFAGTRCDRIVAGVLARLNEPA